MVDVMSIQERRRQQPWQFKPVAMQTAAIAIAAVLAGCSADVARFDEPAFGLTDSQSPGAASATSGGSTFSQLQPDPAPYSGQPYTPPAVTGSRQVQTAALREVERPSYQPPVSPRSYAPPQQPEKPIYQPVSSGESITVVRGDTLYGLARRHGVTVTELMTTNQLSSSMLKPGQRLVLPNGANAASPTTYTAAQDTSSSPQVSEEPVTAPTNWNGTYEIASGDSLYTIALKYGIRSAELQRYNGIADPRRLRPGTVLKVPGNASTSRYASSGTSNSPSRSVTQSDTATTARQRIIAAPRVMAPSSAEQPAILNSSRNQRVVALSPNASGVANDATTTASSKVKTVNVRPPSATALSNNAKLSWPIRGKILSSFGQRTDGTHNDGVNIAAPLGADVMAAQKGVVAYAGSELKGYGNLILIRHDNGWVTAYAHNDKLLVKRGDKVERGSVIAKAGKSGQVDKPQVHFELRQGAKPVDPLPFLARS